MNKEVLERNRIQNEVDRQSAMDKARREAEAVINGGVGGLILWFLFQGLIRLRLLKT